MDQYINISLSNLIKQSAKQLCYLRLKHSTHTHIHNQLNLTKVLNDKNISRYDEMRGTCQFGILRINYTFSEMKVNDVSAELIEYKQTSKDIHKEMWYFESCILHSATYQAFAKINPHKILRTASFSLQKGNPLQAIDLTGLYLRSILHMDGKKYKIIVSDAKKIVKFFIEKAIASLDYDTAKKFDKEFKHKEFATLSPHMIYRSLSDKKVKSKTEKLKKEGL